MKRLIKVVLLPKLLDLLRGGHLACHQGGRIGGDHPGNDKDQDQESENGGHGIDDPFECVC